VLTFSRILNSFFLTNRGCTFQRDGDNFRWRHEVDIDASGDLDFMQFTSRTLGDVKSSQRAGIVHLNGGCATPLHIHFNAVLP